jgi:hypothetical protein
MDIEHENRKLKAESREPHFHASVCGAAAWTIDMRTKNIMSSESVSIAQA